MYLDRCRYVETYEAGKHVYVFTGPCVVTGKPYTVKVPAPGLFKLRQGALVQDAFPDLSFGDREFIVTGTSPEGWKQLFPDGEDDDIPAGN